MKADPTLLMRSHSNSAYIDQKSQLVEESKKTDQEKPVEEAKTLERSPETEETKFIGPSQLSYDDKEINRGTNVEEVKTDVQSAPAGEY